MILPKRSVAVFVAAALFALSSSTFLSCRKKGTFETRERPLIGFVMDSFVEERWTRDRDVFMATAASLGADVDLQIGEENPTTQEAQIEYLLERGIDALVLVASDPIIMVRSVQNARRRSVPVLLYERVVRNAGADLYLAYDAERVGELQARSIVSKIGKGAVVVYNGQRNNMAAEMAHEGVMKVLEPLVAAGTIRIVEDYWPTGTNSEEAYAFMDGLLGSGVAVDGVIASNDLHAEAIIRALALRRLAGKVAVAGADADLAACQRIAEGTQEMTVYKPIDQIAAKAAELAVFLSRDIRFTVHNAIDDGAYRVPYYELDPISVNAANLRATVVKDGFHLEEEVYRNVLPN
jgi:D-xylose transport system substrate-binding protein